MSDAGITKLPESYGKELQHRMGEEPWRPEEARQSLHVKPNLDMAGAAACLSAKLALANSAAGLIYHRVIITEPDATKWANEGQLKPIITVATNFAKTVITTVPGADGLVPEPNLIIAALRMLHAPPATAGHGGLVGRSAGGASVHHNTAA